MTEDLERVDQAPRVSTFFRLQRWEIEAANDEEFPSFGGRVPVDDHQRGGGGGLRTGGLLTAVDSMGGLMAGLAVLPEWIVTTTMTAKVARLVHRGPLRLHGRILRRGRNAVVVGTEVVDEGDRDRPVAAMTTSFAVLDAGDMDLSIARPVSTPLPPPDPQPQSVEEFFCIQPGTGPVTRLDLGAHLRNPWGILHGGAVAVLADVAACRAVEACRPGGAAGEAAVGDTVLHYLRPVRTGPVEARCQVWPGGPGRSVVRVSVHDVGEHDRQVSLASMVVRER